MGRRLSLMLVLLLLFWTAWTPGLAQGAVSDDSAPAQPGEAQQANVEVLDAVLGIIRQRFFDREFCGIDLDELRSRYLQRAAEAQPGAPLHTVLREMLAEFKVSHLTIIDAEAYANFFAPEMDNTTRRQVGFTIAELAAGQYFIVDVLAGGPAEQAGILRGDRVVRLNGADPADSGLLIDTGGDPGLGSKAASYFLRNPPEEADLIVTLQREAGGDFTVAYVRPDETSMIRATANSVTVIEHEGRRLGYIRFWHFLHRDAQITLRRALTETFADCDGLIVDLRGRGGSPFVMNACFAPFGEPPPMRRGRGRGMMTRADYNMPAWDKPAVLLQDAGSRSAKEVYAHNWKWLGRGPVVGESTPGAVLGSGFVQLPDKSWMIYPGQEVHSLAYGNVRLEGNPVKPTHAVKDIVPYTAGADTIKQAGIKILSGLLDEAPKPEPRRHEAREEAF
jgi:carboxyl-terminal processing protease